jgi:hypothetical protein
VKTSRVILLASAAVALLIGAYFIGMLSAGALLAALALLFIGALVRAARLDVQDPLFRGAEERRRAARDRKEEVERAGRERL